MTRFKPFLSSSVIKLQRDGHLFFTALFWLLVLCNARARWCNQKIALTILLFLPLTMQWWILILVGSFFKKNKGNILIQGNPGLILLALTSHLLPYKPIYRQKMFNSPFPQVWTAMDALAAFSACVSQLLMSICFSLGIHVGVNSWGA